MKMFNAKKFELEMAGFPYQMFDQNTLNIWCLKHCKCLKV